MPWRKRKAEELEEGGGKVGDEEDVYFPLLPATDCIKGERRREGGRQPPLSAGGHCHVKDTRGERKETEELEWTCRAHLLRQFKPATILLD